MLVSAIVVTLNARELLLECLSSIERALDRVNDETEIIVVDNGSTDGAPTAVRERFAQVRLLELGANRGFPAGVNEGMRISTGQWLLLLNNDATIEPDAVSELLEAAEGRSDVGSLAAQMRFVRDGAINSAGFGVDRLGVSYEHHVGEPPDSGGSAIHEVFGACAGAALMRRAMLAQIDGFDGSFFLYLEDVDVAWRAQMCGWRCLYVPSAVVHHHHAASSVHRSALKHTHVGRNRVLLLAKNMPTGHLLRYAPAIIAREVAYVVFSCITDRTWAPLRGRWRGIRQWRTYRARGRGRSHVMLATVEGPWRALARRRAALLGTQPEGRSAASASAPTYGGR